VCEEAPSFHPGPRKEEEEEDEEEAHEEAEQEEKEEVQLPSHNDLHNWQPPASDAEPVLALNIAVAVMPSAVSLRQTRPGE
jgi:ABC-type Zn2+ transport system substrate-binding protein/surface adhesin